MREILSLTREAMSDNKWLFIWDKIGTLDTWYRYQGNLCSFDREAFAYAAGRKSGDEALKVMRDAMVTVQQNSGRLCIDLGQSCPNFADREFLKPEIFTGEQAFYRGQLPQCLPREDDLSSQYTIMDEVSMALRSTV